MRRWCRDVLFFSFPNQVFPSCCSIEHELDVLEMTGPRAVQRSPGLLNGRHPNIWKCGNISPVILKITKDTSVFRSIVLVVYFHETLLLVVNGFGMFFFQVFFARLQSWFTVVGGFFSAWG